MVSVSLPVEDGNVDLDGLERKLLPRVGACLPGRPPHLKTPSLSLPQTTRQKGLGVSKDGGGGGGNMPVSPSPGKVLHPNLSLQGMG